MTITSPGRQTVTFASELGTTIKVSDVELKPVEASGYKFMPNYSNTTLTVAGAGYVLAADGGSFNKNAAGDIVEPFRPYFTGAGSGSRAVEQIIFGNDESELEAEEEHGDPRKGASGTLKIYTKKDKIYVQSSLSFTEDLRIVTPAGITVATFTVKPGQKVEVQADFSGIYVVHTLDGKYIKKLSVKK